MEKIKSTSLKVISLLTNITYYSTLIVLVLVFVTSILSYTNVYNKNSDNKNAVLISIPFSVELNEVGTYKTDEGLSELNLSSYDSNLMFKNPPKNIVLTSDLFHIIYLLLTFYLVHLFRNFIKNVKENKFFVYENARIFKQLGYGSLILWGVEFLSSFIISLLVSNNILFNTVNITSRFESNIDFNHIIFSLFLIVLSHIFNQGIKLQEEKDLTI